MQPDATKVYSTRQENMIASYLGWETVPASGARDFNPGDIISDRFLGECKTHVSHTNNIAIYFDVWAKLDSEAMSQMRVPVLFVDNGTQQAEHTWAILPATFAVTEKDIAVGGVDLRLSRTKASFHHFEMKQVLCGMSIGKFKCHRTELALMSLATFKYLIEAGV